MVMHVIHALAELDVERTVVVVGHGAERVTKKVQEQAPAWAKVSLRRADRAARHRRRHARRAHRLPRRRPRRHVDGRRPPRRHAAAAARDARRTGHRAPGQRARRDDADHHARRSDRLRASRPGRRQVGRRTGAAHRRAARCLGRRARHPRGQHVDVRLPPRPARAGAAPRHPGQRPGRVLPHRRDRLAGGDGPPHRLGARRPRRRPRASTTAGSWPSPSASCAAAPTATG